MSNVRIPDVKVSVVIGGSEICRVEFWNVERSPDNWEITGSLIDGEAREAVRACLLASAAELTRAGWEVYTFAPDGEESTDETQLSFLE